VLTPAATENAAVCRTSRRAFGNAADAAGFRITEAHDRTVPVYAAARRRFPMNRYELMRHTNNDAKSICSAFALQSSGSGELCCSTAQQFEFKKPQGA
jgi:hypothetical protein